MARRWEFSKRRYLYPFSAEALWYSQASKSDAESAGEAVALSLLAYLTNLNFFFCLLSFVFSGQHPRHMEVPRLGVRSELQLQVQLQAYATAAAMPDLSLICDLHHSSRQRRILNPLNKARDRTRNFMVPSQIHFCCGTMGTPPVLIHFYFCSVYYVLNLDKDIPVRR